LNIDTMKLNRPLRELIAATFSPFHADGSIAPEVVPTQASFLAANDITTVFITGTTGESHSLTCDERLALYDAWGQAGRAHGLAVIAHVGDNSIENARRLARRAGELELAATSAIPPTYFKPADLKAVVDWCATVASAAPNLPFYYYDIPKLTGVSVPVEDFLIEAGRRIPNFAGVKVTNPDVVSYRRSLDIADQKFDLPWGMDEALLAGLATGAQSAVGSTYNFAPRLYVDLMAAFNRGDLAEARRLQSLSIAMVDALATTDFIGTAKALMVRLGVPVGQARAPLGNPTLQEFESVFERLVELGFQKWGADGQT
jgi:Dihydrodipicolinate synthase/N-acetylneuraminate lyase